MISRLNGIYFLQFLRKKSKRFSSILIPHRAGAISPMGTLPPQKRKKWVGSCFPKIIFSICRMMMIRCALDSAELSGPFRYPEHVRNTNIEYSETI